MTDNIKREPLNVSSRLSLSSSVCSKMNNTPFNLFCNSLHSTTYVQQWRGSHVWKVGGKVFAIGNWNRPILGGITFKTAEATFEHLKGLEGLRPAPYFATRGLKWIQYYTKGGLSEASLKVYIRQSHGMVSAALPKTIRQKLGFPQATSVKPTYRN